MKLITSKDTMVLLYGGESSLLSFNRVTNSPDIEPGDVLVVSKGQGNSLVYDNLGFIDISSNSEEYFNTIQTTEKEE